MENNNNNNIKVYNKYNSNKQETAEDRRKKEAISINKIINEKGIKYSYGAYIRNGQIVEDIDALITKLYKEETYKPITQNTLNTIKLNIKNLTDATIYDFDEVPFKIYFNRVAKSQNEAEAKRLKDKYAVYLESIQDKNTFKQCIYISGSSGSGKTTYAKILAEKHYKKEEIYITAGGAHPFDEYQGEKVIIIDDFRDSVIPYNDLLRLLDNNTTSNVGARYHNKNLARCELIILTSVKNPIDLYKGIEEERFQLYRRINFLYIDDDFLEFYEFNKKEQMYNKSNEIYIGSELEEYKKAHMPKNRININDIFTMSKVIDIDESELPF